MRKQQKKESNEYKRKAWQPENDINDTFNCTLKYKEMIQKGE